MNRRWIVAAGVFVLLLAGVSGWIGVRSAIRSAATDILGERARAVRAGDRAAFLRTADGGTCVRCWPGNCCSFFRDSNHIAGDGYASPAIEEPASVVRNYALRVNSHHRNARNSRVASMAATSSLLCTHGGAGWVPHA